MQLGCRRLAQPNMLFLIVKRRLLIERRLFCSRGWRRKQCPGARRQHRRRQPGKNRPLLALADGETKLPEERGANIGAASLGKTGPCWRWRTEKQGVSGSKAPTKAPSARENLAPVGVGGRRNKASRGARRQHRRRQPEKILGMLAWADGETRRCREQSANKGAVSPGKTGPCWRWRTEKQDSARSEAPTKAPSVREKPDPVGVGGRRNKASRGARRQHIRPRGVSNAGRFREIGRDDDRSSRSERLSSIFLYHKSVSKEYQPDTWKLALIFLL